MVFSPKGRGQYNVVSEFGEQEFSSGNGWTVRSTHVRVHELGWSFQLGTVQHLLDLTMALTSPKSNYKLSLISPGSSFNPFYNFTRIEFKPYLKEILIRISP